MTARPLRSQALDNRLRVIPGSRTRRPATAPWVVVSVIAVVAFLGLVGARTALDRAAFDLMALDTAIAEQATVNQRLRIEIAEMENPARIAPLAEELGLVIPSQRSQLLVSVGRSDETVDPGLTTHHYEPTS